MIISGYVRLIEDYRNPVWKEPSWDSGLSPPPAEDRNKVFFFS